MSAASPQKLESSQHIVTGSRRQVWLLFAASIAMVIVVLQFLGFRQAHLVNPNKATRQELMSIPGLGPEIADRILLLRPFTDASDLVRRFNGIGARKLEQIMKVFDFDEDGAGDCCVP
ncbi:MAG: ComEA family DNA-binding protein [Prosthecobacter sp.]